MIYLSNWSINGINILPFKSEPLTIEFLGLLPSFHIFHSTKYSIWEHFYLKDIILIGTSLQNNDPTY